MMSLELVQLTLSSLLLAAAVSAAVCVPTYHTRPEAKIDPRTEVVFVLFFLMLDKLLILSLNCTGWYLFMGLPLKS